MLKASRSLKAHRRNLWSQRHRRRDHHQHQPADQRNPGLWHRGHRRWHEYSFEGSVGGALVKDRFGQLSAKYIDREGYLDNITRGEKADRFEDLTLRGRLIWEPTDSLSLDLRAALNQPRAAESASSTRLWIWPMTTSPPLALVPTPDRSTRTMCCPFGTTTSISANVTCSIFFENRLGYRFWYTDLHVGVHRHGRLVRLGPVPLHRCAKFAGTVWLRWHANWLFRPAGLSPRKFVSARRKISLCDGKWVLTTLTGTVLFPLSTGVDTGPGIIRLDANRRRIPRNPTKSFLADDNNNNAIAVLWPA